MSLYKKFKIVLIFVLGLFLSISAMAAKISFFVSPESQAIGLMPYLPQMPNAGSCVFPGVQGFSCKTDANGKFDGVVSFVTPLGVPGPNLMIKVPGSFTFQGETNGFKGQVSPNQWDGKSDMSTTITFTQSK